MSLRIVLTDTWSWPDVRRGGERYLHELAAALSHAGHTVSILTTGRTRGAEVIEGVPVRRVPQRRPWPHRLGDAAPEVAFGAQSLAALLLAGFDVWHATSIPDGAAAAVAGRVRPGLRTVFTDHGFPVERSRRRRPDWRLQHVLARHIDSYICVSRAAGACLRSDYGREATIVPPGVDLRRFTVPAERHAVPAVFYSGSLVEARKNVPLLLDAVALLRRRVPAVELWLAGPGDVAPTLREHPNGAAAVTLAASLDDLDLASRYGRAWVTALPSRAESFGMAVIESWACGTPAVVLRDSGGPAEIVHEGVGVVSEETAEAFAEALARALDLA
ncbi:MAG TPA: glycosyltransferase family 4 protein, partial [Mycobacteriales bacterium]|nr:glycosyltransferase family 4 protein [Mycobacteriales bacterium]